jgi:5-methylcytosine-specific restriction endonuclease McrA
MLSGSDSNLLSIMYLIIRRDVGEWRARQYRYARKSYLKKRGYPTTCDMCHKPMTKKDSTIDHIIPRCILIQCDLPALEFHHSNFQVVHQKCNGSRNDLLTVEQLPHALQARIRRAQDAGLYQDMGVIPIARPFVLRQYKPTGRVRILPLNA